MSRWQLPAMLALCVQQQLSRPAADETYRTTEVFREFLDCRRSINADTWAAFHKSVWQVAASGFEFSDRVLMQSLGLFNENWQVLLTESELEMEHVDPSHRPIWMNFEQSICEPNVVLKGETCYYGLMNAAWYTVRMHASALKDDPGGHVVNFLNSMCSLLGLQLKYMDFSEDSSWPIQLIDIVHLCGKEDFQLPSVQDRFVDVSQSRCDPTIVTAPWHSKRGDLQAILVRRGQPATLLVWEFGIHKSMSAELITSLYSTAKRRGVSLRHRSVISNQHPRGTDVQACDLYHAAGMECSLQSDELALTSFLNEKISDAYFDGHLLLSMNHVCKEMDALAEMRASDVDLIAITTLPLLMLALVLGARSLRGKPLVIYISSMLLDMVVPSQTWPLQTIFSESIGHPNRAVVAQDRWTSLEALHMVGKRLPVVPGLSLYTGVSGREGASQGLLLVSRPRDVSLVCLLSNVLAALEPAEKMPHYFIAKPFSWQHLSEYTVAAFFPHTYFLLLFEELYRMALPMLIPRQLNKHVYQIWFTDITRKYHYLEGKNPMTFHAIVDHLSLKYHPWNSSTYHNVAFTDYFCRPFIEYFDSLAHMLDLTAPEHREHFLETRRKLVEHNRMVGERVLDFWGDTLAQILQ